MEVIKTYNIFLDTRNRDSGTASDASFNLVKPLTLSTKGSSFFRIKLISATIPFSFTQVNSSNSVVNITINAVPNTLTIPYGNYNIISLLDEIKTQLLVLLPSNTFNFTYNSSTNKVSMVVSGGSSVAIEFLYSSSINWVGLMLGFTSSFNFSNVVVATSNQNVNVSPAKTLFVRSTTLLQSQNYESIIGRNNFSDIIGQIPIYQGSQSWINFYDSNNFFSRLNNIAIDTINIYLTDATNDNEILNLTLDSFYALEIQEVYQKPFNNGLVEPELPINKSLSQDITREQDKLIGDLGDNIKTKKEELLKKLSLKNKEK